MPQPTTDPEEHAFSELTPAIFYTNGGVALFGLIVSTCLTIHVIYGLLKPKKTRRNLNPNMVRFAICTMLSTIFVFVVYCIEHFLFRVFVPNAFTTAFCHYFAPFLVGSLLICAYMHLHYFTIRLDSSFKASSLAFSKYFFIKIRVIYIIFISIFGIISMLLGKGVPYNVDQQHVTNDNPWLCRMSAEWSQFWFVLTAIGFIMALIPGLINWLLFFNRLYKVIALGFKHDSDFIKYYGSKTTISQQNPTFQIDVQINENDKLDETQKSSLSPPTSPHSPRTPGSPRTMSVNTNSANSRESSTSTSLYDRARSSIYKMESDRKERNARRKQKEKQFYRIIKKQTILSGSLSLVTILFWIFQAILDYGSICMLLDAIAINICVYLSFEFTDKCFSLVCSKCMNDCTCIEDCIEKKLAHELIVKTPKENQEPIQSQLQLTEVYT